MVQSGGLLGAYGLQLGQLGEKHTSRVGRDQFRFIGREEIPDYGRGEPFFRVELFNMLNHPQFQIPAAVIATSGVGTITSTSNIARQMQFALRLTF